MLQYRWGLVFYCWFYLKFLLDLFFFFATIFAGPDMGGYIFLY